MKCMLIIRRPVATLLLFTGALVLFGCEYSHVGLLSGPAISKSKEYNLEDGRYFVNFGNHGAVPVFIEEGAAPKYIADIAVTEITVRRLEPFPLTQHDAERAYEVATKYCRSLLRRADPAEERGKAYFWTDSATWVFTEACR